MAALNRITSSLVSKHSIIPRPEKLKEFIGSLVSWGVLSATNFE